MIGGNGESWRRGGGSCRGRAKKRTCGHSVCCLWDKETEDTNKGSTVKATYYLGDRLEKLCLQQALSR